MKIKLLNGDMVELTADNIGNPEVQQALAALNIHGYKNNDGKSISLEEIVDFDDERTKGVNAKFTELQLRLNGGDASNLPPPPRMLSLHEIHVRKSASAQSPQPRQAASNDECAFNAKAQPKKTKSTDEFAANLRNAFKTGLF